MPLLVACRSPAVGTPGVRTSPPSCSCTRRTTRRQQRMSEFRSFRLPLALHGALRRTRTMPLLVAADHRRMGPRAPECFPPLPPHDATPTENVEFRSFHLTLALHGALRRTRTMPLLVACRSPADGTPGARLLTLEALQPLEAPTSGVVARVFQFRLRYQARFWRWKFLLQVTLIRYDESFPDSVPRF